MYPREIKDLIDELATWPSVGPKSAERYVLNLLKKSQEEINILMEKIKKIKNIISCQECGNLSEKNICDICANPKRNKNILCAIGDQQTLNALEKTGEFNGFYFILGGVVDTVNGIGPDNLKIKELIARLKKEKDKIDEIILAFDPDLNGETTVLYLTKLIKENKDLQKMKISRLARGLPMGSDIDYADEITLGNAIKERKEI
ncbi:MAG: recombination mediator RecR [Patescibacteria group bacterium]